MARESLQETLVIPIAESNGRSPSDPDAEPSDPSLARTSSSSRLNARAPEFIPRASNRTDPRPHQGMMGPHAFSSPRSQNHGGEIGSSPPDKDASPAIENSLPEEVVQKVVNQVRSFLLFLNF